MRQLRYIALFFCMYNVQPVHGSVSCNGTNTKGALAITGLPSAVNVIIGQYLDNYMYLYGVNVDYQHLAEIAHRNRTNKCAHSVRFSSDQKFSVTTTCQIKCNNGNKNYSKEITVKLYDHMQKKSIDELAKKMVEHEDLEDLYQNTGVSIPDIRDVIVIYSTDRSRSAWLFPKEIRFYSNDVLSGPSFQLTYNGFHCFAISPDCTKLAVAYANQVYIYTIDHTQSAHINSMRRAQVIDKLSVFADASCINLFFYECYLIAQLVRENKSPMLAQWIHEGRFVFWRNQKQELENV